MEGPPIKTFLFTICFLGFFGILVMTMPPQFIYNATQQGYTAPGYSMRNESIPEVFSSSELLAFSDQWAHTFNETGGEDFGDFYILSFELSGKEYELTYADPGFEGSLDHTVELRHVYTWGWFFETWHSLKWWDSSGFRFDDRGPIWFRIHDYEEYEATGWGINETYNNQPYRPECGHMALNFQFWFNDTTYENVTDAWDNSDLHVWAALEWEELQTGYNALDMIGMILFFQMPNVHWVVNAFISIPIWVCIAWIVTSYLIAFIKSLPFT